MGKGRSWERARLAGAVTAYRGRHGGRCQSRHGGATAALAPDVVEGGAVDALKVERRRRK